MKRTDLHLKITGTNENNFLIVYIYGLKFLDSENDWEKNILDSYIELNSGGFSAKTELELTTMNFTPFKKKLKELYKKIKNPSLSLLDLDKSASFGDLILSGLKIFIHNGSKNGRLILRCTLTDSPVFEYEFDEKNELMTEFEFKETQIKKLIKQIKRITTEFPVIGEMK
jgi:hypothetical protein